MIKRSLCRVLPAVVCALVLAGCLEADPVQEAPAIEWNQVTTPLGSINVAVVRPTDEGTRNHPVIVALPWGAGTAELVEAFIARYWLTEPAARGFYVVAPEVLGSSLEVDAVELIPALFDWMEAELTGDLSNVALVGASNGGRGAFFAAVAEPQRFQAIMTLPGMYRGAAVNLAPLADTPIRMIVGEFDTTWVTATEETAAALESQGNTPEVDIAGTQGHVLDLNPSGLMNWIENALAR